MFGQNHHLPPSHLTAPPAGDERETHQLQHSGPETAGEWTPAYQLYMELDKLSLSNITIEGPANLSQLCQTVTADKILLLFVVRQCPGLCMVFVKQNKTQEN